MPQRLTIGVAQVHTQASLKETLSALRSTTQRAASKGVSILLFPEAYLGGYPRKCDFGAAVGARSEYGREQFLQYFKNGVDLGDIPAGGGEDWIERKQPVNKETGRRGDGTREFLEEVAAQTGVFIVTGVVERAGGSLYCAALYIDPVRGVLGKRRKVMPTGSERLVWAQGQPSTLKAVAATIKGVRVVMGAAICWENYMPLLRYSLYSQNVNLWLAPTADARDTWEALMRTIATEGRCFVISANQCIRTSKLPGWITNPQKENTSTIKSKKPVQQSQQQIPAAPKTPAQHTATANGVSNGSSGRRMSMTTRTQDNHEICWKVSNKHETPSATPTTSIDNMGDPTVAQAENTSPTSGGRRKSIIKTEDNHEICWRTIGETDRSSNAPPSSKTISTAKIDPVDEDPVAEKEQDTTADDEENNHTNRQQQNGDTGDTDNHKENEPDELACRGGSCIIDPMGKTIVGPIWEKEDELVCVEVDFDDCERGRLDLDVCGHYSRSDAFKLTVEGLDLNPPP